MLLERKADPAATDRRGLTAAEMCKGEGPAAYSCMPFTAQLWVAGNLYGEASAATPEQLCCHSLARKRCMPVCRWRAEGAAAGGAGSPQRLHRRK